LDKQMANSTITYKQPAEGFVFIASSASRPKRNYADGKATEAPKTDAKGRPVFGFDAVGRINGQEVQVQVECAQALPDQVPFGTVWQGSGDPATVSIRATANGTFASLVVRVDLDGFTPMKH
jgi:hypothetical protein